MKRNELKPCPFCGSKAKSVPFRHRVQCTLCSAIMVGNSKVGQERIVAAWNQRAEIVEHTQAHAEEQKQP